MKRTLIFLVMFGFAAAGHTAQAPLLAHAVEAGRIEILVGNDGSGTVIAYECDRCPLQLSVDTDTQFKVGNKVIALDKAKLHSRRGGTVIYWAEQKRAKAIQW